MPPADDAERPVALVAHGSGSTADFITRAFRAPLAAAGYRLVTWDRRGVSGREAARQFDDLARTSGALLVGGVSSGALLAVRHAVARPTGSLTGVLLALPPWLGAPGAVARLSADAATAVATGGVPATLARIRQTAVPWVSAELTRAWSAYDPVELIADLEATARTRGPELADLAGCHVPAGVVALADDPFHPAVVAEQWARAHPRAMLVTVPMGAPAAGVEVIGAAAVRAWRAAASLSASR